MERTSLEKLRIQGTERLNDSFKFTQLVLIQDSDIYQTHHTLLDIQRGELSWGEKRCVKGNIMCWRTNFPISWSALGWLWWLSGQGEEKERIEWVRGWDWLDWGQGYYTWERREKRRKEREVRRNEKRAQLCGRRYSYPSMEKLLLCSMRTKSVQ